MSKAAREKKKHVVQQQLVASLTESTEMPGLFSNTVYTLDDESAHWEAIYMFFLE